MYLSFLLIYYLMSFFFTYHYFTYLSFYLTLFIYLQARRTPHGQWGRKQRQQAGTHTDLEPPTPHFYPHHATRQVTDQDLPRIFIGCYHASPMCGFYGRKLQQHCKLALTCLNHITPEVMACPGVVRLHTWSAFFLQRQWQQQHIKWS